MRGIQIQDSSSGVKVSSLAVENETVPAVASTPGWHVLCDVSVIVSSNVSLEVVGRVSSAGLTMNARLFDYSSAAAVASSSVAITATSDDTQTSSAVALVEGNIYQIQVEVVGGADAANFGTVTSATLV